MSDEAKKTKPGPEPERLVIEGDPAEALDRLLGKPPIDKGERARARLEREIAAEWPGTVLVVKRRDYGNKVAVVTPDGEDLALLPVPSMTPDAKKQEAFKAIRRWLAAHPAE